MRQIRKEPQTFPNFFHSSLPASRAKWLLEEWVRERRDCLEAMSRLDPARQSADLCRLQGQAALLERLCSDGYGCDLTRRLMRNNG